MRDWLMQKSQPKVEIIELSPMSTAPVTPQVYFYFGFLNKSKFTLFDVKTSDTPYKL